MKFFSFLAGAILFFSSCNTSKPFLYKNNEKTLLRKNKIYMFSPGDGNGGVWPAPVPKDLLDAIIVTPMKPKLDSADQFKRVVQPWFIPFIPKKGILVKIADNGTYLILKINPHGKDSADFDQGAPVKYAGVAPTIK